jgi:hypothetical protein
MKWIEIEKEKPVLGQFVIISDGHHVGEGIFAPKDDFLIFNHNVIEPWEKITHWMPLPNPPKIGNYEKEFPDADS